MSLTLSQPVRMAALLGLIAAAGLLAWMTILRPSGASSPPVHHLIRHPHAHGRSAAAHAGRHAAQTRLRPTPAEHTRATHTAAKPARRIPAHTTPRPSDGLPAAISSALATHRVVVAFLFDPHAAVDATAAGEAHSGAAAANVGFVPVDVLDKEQVQALTERFGVVSDPAVLVFRAPGRLYVRFDGFVDRETVAQAAQNALIGAGS